MPITQRVKYPDDTETKQDFREPIKISWDPDGGLRSHLCAGTKDGTWDICSGALGKRKQHVFDFSDLPKDVPTVYVQLVSTKRTKITDDKGKLHEHEEDAYEPVIQIHRL